MATLKYTSPVDMRVLTLIKDIASLSYGRSVVAGSWTEKLDDSTTGLRVVFSAANALTGALSIDPITGDVIGGPIKTITFYEGATILYQYTGVNLDPADINRWADTYDDQDFLGTILSGRDLLVGSNRADFLWSSDGKDTIDGGAGADTMDGGFGNDTYRVDNVGDVVRDAAPDWDKDSMLWDLYSNTEVYKYLGGSPNATPTPGTSDVDPNTGYLLDDARIPIANGSGIDLIISSVSYALDPDSFVENLTLSGSVGLAGTGDEYGNVIRGTIGNDTLIGGGGRDVIQGGKGADIIHIENSGFGAAVANLTAVAGDSDYNVSRVVIGVGQSTSSATLSNRDTIYGFTLGEDRLDMPNNFVAANGPHNAGINAGTILSDTITNGIIQFFSTENFSGVVNISSGNLQSALTYLSAHIVNHEAVAFSFNGTDTYVFSDSGTTVDNLVLLSGTAIGAGGLSSQFAANGIWIV